MIYSLGYLYYNKLMGINRSKIRQGQNPHIQEERELTPLQQWNLSDHSQQHLLRFLQNSGGWSECGPAIANYLHCLNSRQKYQHCVSIVLEYFRNQNAYHRCSQTQCKELFTYYLSRLANSFFVVQQFHQSSINLTLKPKQKLSLLYQYYPNSEELMEKAILFSYPSIFVQTRQFVQQLIERQIVVKDVRHFLRLVIGVDKVNRMKQEFQKMGRWMTRTQYQKSINDLKLVFDLKKIYWLVIEQFMKNDNADISTLILQDMLIKGYQFTQNQFQYYLKIQLFGMFIYSLGKVTISFQSFLPHSILDILDIFYTQRNIEQTSLIKKCFQIFSDNGQCWHKWVLQYCFSDQAKLSLLVRLIQGKYIEMKGSQIQFSGLINKIVNSRSDVGKWSSQLIQLVNLFGVDPQAKDKFVRLVKVLECLHVFNLDIAVQQIYPIIYTDPTSSNSQGITLYRQNGLSLFKMLISNYLKQSQIVDKTITIDSTTFQLVNLYDLLQLLHFLKIYAMRGYMNSQVIHQLLFQELVNKGYYEQISVLVNNQNTEKYGIIIQTVEMLVVEHLGSILTTQKIKKNQHNISILMSILSLQNYKKQTKHHIAAMYRYFKYLQDKNIVLPPQTKKQPSIQHFYYILDTFYNKLDNIDFDYLFGQISCINQHWIQGQNEFQIHITQEFLKFKIYFCSKCFAIGKDKLGQQIIEEVMEYQPPWLGSALVKILKENQNVDQGFFRIAFRHCSKGQDLQYIVNTFEKKKNEKKQGSASKLSLKNIKKLGQTLKAQKYVFLSNDLITSQQQYINLVAQMTFDKDETFRSQTQIFFRLLTTDPQRSFNYAVNYIKDVVFLMNFVKEGVRRDIIHLTNSLQYVVRYLYFKLIWEDSGFRYIRYDQFVSKQMSQILASVKMWEQKPSISTEVFGFFKKFIKNYQARQLYSQQFLNLYVKESQLFQFVFDQGDRKVQLMQIRLQPMTKTNTLILKKLCQMMSVDIIELSLYELFGKVNARQEIDEQAWNIIQKLVHWGEEKKIALGIVKKMGQKVQSLGLLIQILDFMRESEVVFGQIVTEQHLQILRSLAAVEQDNAFFGIIPENYFDRPIGVYDSHARGILSQTHRRIIEQNGVIQNIFIISKALFFMYGCDEEIEKVVLGQFSLKQEDSEEFELLRKKIKNDMDY